MILPFDWIAGFLELMGLYIVGNKNKIGFISYMGTIVNEV